MLSVDNSVNKNHYNNYFPHHALAENIRFHIIIIQVAVNLIDKKKAEGELEAAFRALFSECAIEGITYEYFDFHHECSKMRYDRLSLLMDQLSRHNFGYFCAAKKQENGEQLTYINQQQTGVFRTNCMDCLDRTNVVQSMLAAENMVKVLSR